MVRPSAPAFGARRSTLWFAPWFHARGSGIGRGLERYTWIFVGATQLEEAQNSIG